MSQKYNKVLILSHNAFSQIKNNGKTLESFFHGWDKNSIAQIFLQPESPDFDFCNRYYRMTDYEVLNNVFFNGKIGKQLSKKISDREYTKDMNPFVKKLYLDRRKGKNRVGFNKIIHKAFINRVPLFTGIREILWKKGNWKTPELVQWINEFSPDVLFFQGNSSIYSYEIALWISESFDIPLVLQLTDDYTTPLYSWSLLERINKKRYMNIFRKTINSASKVITISDYMLNEYKEEYGGDYRVLMNTVNRNFTSQEPQGIRLIYAGNISLDRWKVLLKIGNALDEINQEYNLDCSLDIFTPTYISDSIISKLISSNSVNYGGCLYQEELNNEIINSNILIHVEAFNERNKKITRLSISTKIPEYMSSKRCIFAVGPKEIASIKYLKENGYAKVVQEDEVNTIKKGLLDIIQNPYIRKEYYDRAYNAYNLRHNPSETRRCILEIINDAIKKNQTNLVKKSSIL